MNSFLGKDHLPGQVPPITRMVQHTSIDFFCCCFVFTSWTLFSIVFIFQVLHRDIENHGKIVGSVVKLCKKSDASCNRANVRRIANGLERRWHLLFLSSLEWQCYLETLTGLESNKVSFVRLVFPCQDSR